MQFSDVGAVSCLVEYAGDERIDGDGMEHYVSWTNICATSDEILGRIVQTCLCASRGARFAIRQYLL